MVREPLAPDLWSSIPTILDNQLYHLGLWFSLLNLGSVDILGLKFPNTFTTSCEDQDCWELQSNQSCLCLAMLSISTILY